MKTLQKITEKFSAVNYNQDNYHVGGGLSDGKFASNRHEDARSDAGKLTLGETCQMFKKATKLETDYVKSVIEFKYPSLEWHHAGKLPKQYGGGMKKTYFVNSEQIVFLSQNFDKIVAEFEQAKIAKAEKLAKEQAKDALKRKFLQENARRFEKKPSTPKYSITTATEMNGKYGWFPADYKYNMSVYYSGWEFESEEKYEEYLDFDRTEEQKRRIKLNKNGMDCTIANVLEKIEGYSVEKAIENKEKVCEICEKLILCPSESASFVPRFGKCPEDFLTDKEKTERSNRHYFISDQGENYGTSYERRLAHEEVDRMWAEIAKERFDIALKEWEAGMSWVSEEADFIKRQNQGIALRKKLTKLVR
jgi:hypothetical protein